MRFAGMALATLVAALFMSSAQAGSADVLDVRAAQISDGSWRFDVTVRHQDRGWDHYADAWQVLAPDGSLLGERILLHPHDNEQPFTRSLSGVSIPPELGAVTIRARDSVHGFGGDEIELVLER